MIGKCLRNKDLAKKAAERLQDGHMVKLQPPAPALKAFITQHLRRLKACPDAKHLFTTGC
jgi:hypothetical protein